MEGGIRWIILLLAMSILITAPSSARMGYDIVATVGGQTFEVHRATENMNFSIDGSINGSGNFSRLTHIKGTTGFRVDELTSSTKKGDLALDEILNFLTREGPVVITVNLSSINLTDENTEIPLIKIKESADIEIDERWPAGLVNYKKIS